MVRRAGACDLLPVGIARLLPHARLRCGNDRVHERARPDARHRKRDQAGTAPRRRPASRARHLAALPAVQGGRARPHRSVYAGGAMTGRAVKPLSWIVAADARRPPDPQHRVRDRSELRRARARTPGRRSRVAGAHARRARARWFARGRDLLARCVRRARTCAARARVRSPGRRRVSALRERSRRPSPSLRSRRSRAGCSRPTSTGAPGSAGTGSSVSSGRCTAISCRSRQLSRSSPPRCSPRRSMSPHGCGGRSRCCARCRRALLRAAGGSRAARRTRRDSRFTACAGRPRAPPAFS